MKEVLELANELANAIKESKEYKRAKEAEQAQANDQNAQEMIKKYNEKRREIAIKMQHNDVNDEQMEDFRAQINDAFEALMENKLIRDYVDAQKDLEELNQQVFSIISGQDQGCAGGCSSCSGCH